MNPPIRIQRRRTKGFSLQSMSPDGRPVVSVCRPGRYGNPFSVKHWLAAFVADRPVTTADRLNAAKAVVADFAADLDEQIVENPKELAGFLAPLRGKHLACFCDLTAPCHADELLNRANDPQLLWHRYDALMRKAGDLLPAEKQELAELRALLVEAGIVVESDIF